MLSTGPERSRTTSGTIAGVFPSVPQDGERDSWGDDASSSLRAAPAVYGAAPAAGEGPTALEPPDSPDSSDSAESDEEDDIEVVPVRPRLSVAIAGFAALLAVGLIVGAQTSGPDARAPYAIVILGVQILYVLVWTTAMRPPALPVVAGVALAAGAVGDYTAVNTETPRVMPLIYLALGGVALVVIAQFALRVNRLRIRDALGSTFLIVLGVVAFAMLVALTRKPSGTQAITVCLTAAVVALLVARLTDAVFPKPRIAPQVPRGATGIIAGAMLGTLAAAGLGSVLVFPFTPAKGAILGLVAAGLAVLVDLAVNFTEVGRGVAVEAPPLWLARHMQGPLGAFAVSGVAAYVLVVFL